MTQSPSTPPPTLPARSPALAKTASRAARIQWLQQLAVLALTLILCGVLIAKSNNAPFLLGSLFTYAAPIGIIAIGMTFVMIAGGFDLSVGSITAACGVVAVLVLQKLSGFSPWLAISIAGLVTLAVGAVLGAINGSLIAYLGINPFVVTLCSMFVFRGVGLELSGGGQSEVVPPGLTSTFRTLYWGYLSVFGLPLSVPVFLFAGVFLVGVYFLRFTRFGHYVYATGGNSNASWLVGINVRAVTCLTYVISGLTCAVAALIWSSLSNTAQASDYAGKEMIVIASVIVGGTPLAGGRGGLFMTLSGLLFLATVEQLLNQFSVSPERRQIVTGLIILIVVAIDAGLKRKK